MAAFQLRICAYLVSNSDDLGVSLIEAAPKQNVNFVNASANDSQSISH